MRFVLRAALLSALLWLLAPAFGGVGILLRLPSAHSPLVIEQLRLEIDRLAPAAGVSFVSDGAVVEGSLFVVSLHGRCQLGGALDRREGPLGSTSVVDGRVLPFIAIDCDRVRATIAPEIENEPPIVRDVQFGRALARVLAHELRHAAGRTLDHGQTGLAKPKLSARELVWGARPLEAEMFHPRQETARAAPRRPPSPRASKPEPNRSELDEIFATGR